MQCQFLLVDFYGYGVEQEWYVVVDDFNDCVVVVLVVLFEVWVVDVYVWLF